MNSPQAIKATRKPSVADALSKFDNLPDSAYVRPQIIAAHADISMATFWRRVKSGALPTLKDGRMNVGEYRRTLASVAA